MSAIRYVVMSDLHLGADTSLLTEVDPLCTEPDPSVPSDVLLALRDCLRSLLSSQGRDKPTLILLGDALEFALARDEIAAMTFERFAECVMKPGEELFDAVVYVPGNHDHHLWETAREKQYADYIREAGTKTILGPWHSTRMLLKKDEPRVESTLLTVLLNRVRGDGAEMTVPVAYPNLALRSADRCVVFHHGHFIESTYSALTKLDQMLFDEHDRPQDVWDLEADNFAWIDFLWSGLGRSGQAGESVEYVYDAFQDPKKEEELIDRLASSIADACDRLPWIGLVPDNLRKSVAELALTQLSGIIDTLGSRAAAVGVPPLSDGQKTGLIEYLDRYVMRQVRREMGDDMPRDISFVFGHTHSPFEFVGLPLNEYSRPVRLYNTGGWNHEKAVREESIGASLVLLSEDLEMAAIRMYDERPYAELAASGVRVAEAREEEGRSAFAAELEQRIAADPAPWRSFVHIVNRTLDERTWRFTGRVGGSLLR
jgi:hypothetical protein